MISGASRYLIQGGTIVTMNSMREVFHGDLRMQGGKISALARSLPLQKGETLVPARGNFVIPGLIQTHTHACQALFRGQADDLSLLDWLTTRIWPLEAAHTHSTMFSSAQLAFHEMQLLGTTSVLDMGSSLHTSAIFEAAQKMKIRFWGGNCWADIKEFAGPIYLNTDDCKRETEDLIHSWHQHTPLLTFVLCPRFALSCSEEILRFGIELQAKKDLLIHTHASENIQEIELIRQRTGLSNVDYLDHIGLLHPKTVLVHGVHLSPLEIRKIVKSQTKLVHCPSSNLKLASGIAPIEKYRQAGMILGLGSDGAPCNNTMDPFMEMRLAALLQKVIDGPTALPAEIAFEMATVGGARVLGRSQDLGSLEVGKAADVVIVDRHHPSVTTVEDPYSALVYSCSGRDVQHVWINGEQVVKDFSSTLLDTQEIPNKF